MRNAVYQHLIAAENALDEAQEQSGPRVRARSATYDLDAFQEVRLENDRLIALAFPAHGGHIGALDLRESLLNVLATFTGVPLASAPALAANSRPAVIPARLSSTTFIQSRQLFPTWSPAAPLSTAISQSEHIMPGSGASQLASLS